MAKTLLVMRDGNGQSGEATWYPRMTPDPEKEHGTAVAPSLYHFTHRLATGLAFVGVF